MKYTKHLYLILLILCCSTVLSGQNVKTGEEINSLDSLAYDVKIDERSLEYLNKIDRARLKTVVDTLASREYEGRGTTQKGGMKTQEYLKRYLADIHVKPSKTGHYGQNINVLNRTIKDRQFLLNGEDHKGKYSFYGLENTDSTLITDQIIFVGYGDHDKEVNHFSGVDIKDKVVMYLPTYSSNKWGEYYVSKPHEKRDAYLVANAPKVLISVGSFFADVYAASSYPAYIAGSSSSVPSIKDIPKIMVNEFLANKLLEQTGRTVKGMQAEIEPTGQFEPILLDFEGGVSVRNELQLTRTDTENIIGFIEGTDLKDEYIVLMAHHDHNGIDSNGKIFFGADDNASGVSGVLEIARVLNMAKKEKKGPRRSVIIILTAAEERGLWGGEYYVNNPIYDLEKTKACINLDMIGRRDGRELYTTHNYLNLNCVETQALPRQIKSISEKGVVDITVNYAKQHYESSDHICFARKSVPSVLFTSSTYSDYHTERDTANKIDYNLMESRTKLAFLSVWHLANPPKESKKRNKK